MNNKIFKYIKYLSYVLLLLGVGVFVYFVVASVLYPEPATEFPVGTVGNAMGVNVMLIYAYVVFAVALVLAIMFPLINIISNPKGAMRTPISRKVQCRRMALQPASQWRQRSYRLSRRFRCARTWR